MTELARFARSLTILAIGVNTVPGKAIEWEFCEGIPDQSPVWRDNVMAAGINELARIKCGG